jgi:hypothetical protein
MFYIFGIGLKALQILRNSNCSSQSLASVGFMQVDPDLRQARLKRKKSKLKRLSLMNESKGLEVKLFVMN